MPIKYEQLAIEIDSQQIFGTFIAKQKERAPGLLFVHGWGATQEENVVHATAAADLGCACLTFNLRGHALTKHQQENVSRADNLQDVIAAYDVLVSLPDVDASAIGIVGTSYGGYLAAIATTLRPVSYLALRAPAIYRDAGWHQPKLQLHKDPELLGYRSRVVPWYDDKALRACAAFFGDVLIVQSEYDNVVPAPVIESYARAFTRARSVRRRVIRGADHSLAEERCRYEYKSLLIDWISDTMLTTDGSRSGRPG